LKLPKLFGKKKDDEDDFDDDIDEEEFDIDDLDDHIGEMETTVVEDDEDLTGNYASGPVSADDPDDDPDDDHDEVMVGSDDVIENPFEGIDDEYDDDLDDDEEYEDEDDESSRKKALIFATIGGGVVITSVLGGVGWFMLSSPDDSVIAASDDPGRVELAMPAPPGSLNSTLGNVTNAVVGESTQAGQLVMPAPATGAQRQIPAQTNADEPSATEPMVDPSATDATAPAGGLNSLNSLNTNQSAGGVVVASVSNAALARLPDHPSAADQSQALSPAPVAALIEDKQDIGQLPVIASNGAQPWQVYARPVDPGITAPRIAIMFEGIGLSRQASLGVINKLPPEISFVLSPYGRNLNDWVFRSRLAGHELFMSLPMESENFPVEDAGPLALDTRIQLAENRRRMETVMASAQGYVGLVTMMGSRFMKADGQVRRVLEDVKARGLMFVVGGNRRRNEVFPVATELNLPRLESEKYIDDEPRIQQIRESLDRLESLAKERGAVLAMARPYPVTIKSVLDWIATLPDKGIILVPASSVATLSPSQGG
jgi:polysaccharide deacetylase 2 family uncharacterized protein YibQ